MRFKRRSRLKSSRGHVRVEQGPAWINWVLMLVAVLVLAGVAVVVITQFVLPAFEEEAATYNNRTWLEYAWANEPVNMDAVRSLGDRLAAHDIQTVYLEAAAWRSDGSILDGEHARAFVEALRSAYPEVEILLWLRMSGGEIAQPQYQTAAIELAGRAVQGWGMDGVHLNGRALLTGSESYIEFLRDLRSAIGARKTLSVTVPPDRQPSDPDVPMGAVIDPNLTWTVDYKQRVALVGVDDMVIMAHASGLTDSGQYTAWAAYQVVSYAEVLGELDRPPVFYVALPTYEASPEHDPAIESVRPAIEGVRRGIDLAGDDGDLFQGVGLYEYKTTDSLEWALFAEHWLGRAPQ